MKPASPYEGLPHAGLSESYTPLDRQRDFLAVFGSESNREQGQRVLATLALFCSPDTNRQDADKPGTLAFKEGQRFVLRLINEALLPRKREPDIERTPNNG